MSIVQRNVFIWTTKKLFSIVAMIYEQISLENYTSKYKGNSKSSTNTTVCKTSVMCNGDF